MANQSKIGTLLNKLSLDPKKEVSAFHEELRLAGLTTLFSPISDLGYFAWIPQGSYKSLSKVLSSSEITECVKLDAKPPNLVPLSTLNLPFAFRSLPAQERANKFPFGKYDVASLHVASKYRDVDFGNVDFAFGGSTLEMLARSDAASNPYMATKLPKSDTILVVKTKDYIQNLADPGFQFERFVTGDDVAPKAQIEFVEHLQLMLVGSYRVLFRAETDALLDEEPVEVKTTNRKYWGTKVMFQMISSGSPMLCHAVKRSGSVVASVNLIQLSEVSRDAFRNNGREQFEENILRNMAAIKDQMKDAKDGQVFKIAFLHGVLQLAPCSTRGAVLLPSSEIMKELI